MNDENKNNQNNKKPLTISFLRNQYQKKKPESKKLKDILSVLQSKEFQKAGDNCYDEEINLSEPTTQKEMIVAQDAYKRGYKDAWDKADIIIQYLIQKSNS